MSGMELGARVFEWEEYHYFYQAQLKFTIPFNCKLRQQTLVSAAAPRTSSPRKVTDAFISHSWCYRPLQMSFTFISGPKLWLGLNLPLNIIIDAFTKKHTSYHITYVLFSHCDNWLLWNPGCYLMHLRPRF